MIFGRHVKGEQKRLLGDQARSVPSLRDVVPPAKAFHLETKKDHRRLAKTMNHYQLELLHDLTLAVSRPEKTITATLKRVPRTLIRNVPRKACYHWMSIVLLLSARNPMTIPFIRAGLEINQKFHYLKNGESPMAPSLGGPLTQSRAIPY